MTTDNTNSHNKHAAKRDTPRSAAVKHSQRLAIWVALLVLLLDQASKWRVEATIPLNTAVAPFPGLYPYFQLAHVANRGAAFGFFSDGYLIFTILALIVAVIILWYNFTLQTQSKLVRVALGLLFGGAVGNLIDRLRQGHVTDFLDFDLSSVINVPLADWAVFNVADMAVVAGVILLAIVMIKDPTALETTLQSADE